MGIMNFINNKFGNKQVIKRPDNTEERVSDEVYAEGLQKVMDFEKNTMAEDLHFETFGYMDSASRVTPVFVTVSEIIENERCCKLIYPSTPKMLEYCVEHLISDSKKMEYLAMEEFLKKCNMVVDDTYFEDKDWRNSIDNCMNHLKEHYLSLNQEDRIM